MLLLFNYLKFRHIENENLLCFNNDTKLLVLLLKDLFIFSFFFFSYNVIFWKNVSVVNEK